MSIGNSSSRRSQKSRKTATAQSEALRFLRRNTLDYSTFDDLFRIQQSSLEETNGSMLRRLRDNALGDRSSKGFKRMLGTPTKKMKLEESQPTGT